MMYQNKKPIAILMAAYNAEKHLSAQIDSIVTQTNSDWILYIRNDGSKDGTEFIIRDYCEKYPDRIVQIDKGGGNLGCRNNFFRLLEVVDSAYYMFSDADDVWLSHKVAASIEALKGLEETNPDMPLMAFCDTIVCDEQLNVLQSSYWNAVGIKPEKFLSYNFMAIRCTAGGACTIFNNEVKRLVFPLADNSLMYDYWLALLVAKHGKFKVIHEPLIYYRQHAQQVSGLKYGKEAENKSLPYKIWQQVKLYHKEARLRSSFGYGPHIKYYWYKLLVVLKTKLS